MAYDLSKHYNLMNIATVLDEDTLNKIGTYVKSAVDSDIASRTEWMEQVDTWVKLAAQVKEHKNYPWPNASNVKYPLITLASLQFHARALPSIITGSRPVICKVKGMQYNPSIQKRATRVSHALSYQIMEQMPEWMDDTDRLFFVLPMVGCVYRKNYYSNEKQRQTSCVLMPHEYIVNYHGKADYSRVTHVMLRDKNDVIEHQRLGSYLNTNLSVSHKDVQGPRDEIQGQVNAALEDDQPLEIHECHCWYDLDEDGYKEPYIITFHYDSGKVLRIVPRWSENKIWYTDDGEVRRIEADNYFTQYTFIPDPTSATHGIGFGHLLGPNNEAVNSLLNQLIDAGTLSNLQSGFIARGVKLPGGAVRMMPGEWKMVNTSGDDLRKSIFPMPVREPSGVLFQLLGMLISSSERVASITDMMVGENPGQNQPATTTMAVLEQGLKVFTGIYKRLHRCLAKEYQKIYELNYYYLSDEDYNSILLEEAGAMDAQASPEVLQATAKMEPASVEQDFSIDNATVLPKSDPNFVSDGARKAKSDSLLQKLAAGIPLNRELVIRKVLEAEGHDDIEELMDAPPPAPDPEQVRKDKELAHTMVMGKLNYELDKSYKTAEALKDSAQAEKFLADAKATGMASDLARYDRILTSVQQRLDAAMHEDKMELEKTLAKQDEPATEVENDPNSV